jgi:8-oxo-dGTP diphosphatase
MPFTPILATLGYILDTDKQRVLMIHRNRRPEDSHFGKYNGLGGKLEAGEDIVTGMCREIREEAGIECRQIRLAGTISWPGFGKGGEDWFGFLFLITDWTGTPRTENAEGTLQWVDVASLVTLPMWDGDKHFLPLVFQLDGGYFHGVMPYRDGKPVSWSYSMLPS